MSRPADTIAPEYAERIRACRAAEKEHAQAAKQLCDAIRENVSSGSERTEALKGARAKHAAEAKQLRAVTHAAIRESGCSGAALARSFGLAPRSKVAYDLVNGVRTRSHGKPRGV
jgi:ferric-dicitrate binding protein FerR (iron transport regulator)